MTQLWVEKYRPENLSEYRGSKKQKEKLKTWLENWEKGDSPILLHGQAGTGKTSIVQALANQKELELVETNASDVRTKSKLKEELKEATRQASFFAGKKLILMDEVDGMASNDRGGLSELKSIIKESRFPVIMTANDAYDSKIRDLRNIAELIELGSVHTNSIRAHLKDILENEGIDYEEGSLKRIARQAGGQMRTAINDLEAVSRGKDKVTVENVKNLAQRDNRQEIFDSLKMIFKTMKISTARQATENLDEDARDFMQWVRENIPREYKKEKDISAAYNWLSKADVFNGRIMKRQNWKLLKYVWSLSSIGVALSKEEKYSGWTKYQYPSKIKNMGSTRAARRKRDEIASKIGGKLHVSGNEAVKMFRFLSKLIENDEENLKKELDLTEEETEFISKFNN